jgi:glycosyltransferase involved in cell wall biosynthesis
MYPYFSIIIPTFNRAHFISRAIESVINQTFSDWELIIVDDGSTDHTKELVASFIEKDKRIKYIYQENAERSAARNNGIDKAKGNFVCFLDSDDYYLHGHLFNLHQNINSMDTIYYVGLLLKRENKLIKRDELTVNGLKQFDQLCLATIHSQQVCIPSKITKEYKFNPSIRIAEDLELWIRINENYNFQYIENSFSVVIVDHTERSIDLKNNVGVEQLATYKFIYSKNHPGNLISRKIKKTLLSTSYFTIFKYWFYRFKRLNCIKYLTLSIIANSNHEQTKYKLNLLIRLILGSNFTKINKIL